MVVSDIETRTMAARRKIRTPEGQVGVVYRDFGNGFCSVQFHKQAYYPIIRTEGLRDITEEEFKREFR